ncbi:TonB-dependent receptor [Spongiibacter taiwanensis]|uniref:TonB-dependent receptor n=1 Tax=Spongiibacter taiwanensis TaxID=1748242 RepID=UPI002035C3F2|nr:TonB-dependent receptor [Spongiibacter taiwanensis]USA41645.1 TonB-dependent receptor [Spongiibacter taiwanensis]
MKPSFQKSALVIAVASAAALPKFVDAAPALEEVVVTANKRAENINDVGLSIAAVTGERMAEQKLTSLEEISSVVPGLVFSSSTSNTPIFTLRGVGFNEQTLGAYPATSLYIDEAPMPFPVLASHAAYDLERVEVLKGPQGILFGQNATGGAINFIAAKPGEEFEAGGDVGIGNYGRQEFNGFVSGPVSETVGARFAFTSLSADEWQKSATRDDENGAEDYKAGRLILEFAPTASSTYLLNINAWQDDSDPQAQQYVAFNPAIKQDAATGNPPANVAKIAAQQFSREDNESADWADYIDPYSDRDFLQIVARGDWDLNDELTLTALTTYQDFEQEQATDGDGLALVQFDLAPSYGEIETWISEVRLSSVNATTKWVIGANVEQSETSEDQTLRYIDSTNYTDQNAYINSSGIALEQDISAYAVFGNVDFSVSDAMTLKVGARYTDSTIEVESCNYAAANMPGAIDAGDGSNVATLFNALGNMLGTAPFDPIGIGDCYTLNDNQVPGDAYQDELSEDNVSWRLGLDYVLDNETLVYANISKGFKSGSYPALAAANFFQLDPVTQESVLAYEAGFKSSLMGNSVQLNGAAFLYDYKDKQLRTKVLDPIFGFLDRLENVPETEIYGVEADITAQLTERLRVSAAFTYLQSEVKKYQGASFTSEAVVDNGQLVLATGEEDFSGDPIPFTPELTYMVDVEYTIPLDGGDEWFAGVNLNGQTESDAAFGGSRLTYTQAQRDAGAKSITPKFNEMDAYSIVNARLGYRSADGHWRVTLWGKNILDEYYVTNVIASSDTSARFVGRPRTFGISVGYTF